MKKSLINKLKRKTDDQEERPSRITNETVAEHRERILAGGRKFKYPIQYAKHKLVINSVIIGLASVALLVLLIWQQLYLAENTSKFIYRVTQLLPVPVASVDGHWVRYSDYLRKYRSSIHYLQSQNQINLRSEDGQRQAEFIKRQELNKAERDAFAMKLAAENDITISNEEVDGFINQQLEARNVSLEAYVDTVLSQYYDWSLDDYRQVVETELLRRKVSFAIDEAARQKIETIQQTLQDSDEDNFGAVARRFSDDEATKMKGGEVGNLPLNNQDPNGVIAAARQLKKGQVSDVIQGSDGYYIVKLIDKNDETIRFAQIKVDLTELEKRFNAVKEANNIEEFIEVEKVE